MLIIGMVSNIAMFYVGGCTAASIEENFDPPPQYADFIRHRGDPREEEQLNAAQQAWHDRGFGWAMLGIFGAPIVFGLVYWPWWTRRYRLTALEPPETLMGTPGETSEPPQHTERRR